MVKVGGRSNVATVLGGTTYDCVGFGPDNSSELRDTY